MTSLCADVAELADAQVSEACDGDIVEVQVLSSAPEFSLLRRRARVMGARFFVTCCGSLNQNIEKKCHRDLEHGVFLLDATLDSLTRGNTMNAGRAAAI